jgi:hypothetical protein
MEAKYDLDDLTKTTQRLEYQDGLRDFQIAIVFLIIGLGNWLIFTPSGLRIVAELFIRFRAYRVPILFGLIGLVLLLLFGMERWMEGIRRRSFWKESGFVKPLRWGVVSTRTLFASAVVILGLIIGTTWFMARGSISEAVALRSIPTSVGIGTGIIFVSVGMRLVIQRYLWVGISGLLLSVGAFLASISLGDAYLIVGLGWSLILGISGAWALRKAVRELRGGAQHE